MGAAPAGLARSGMTQRAVTGALDPHGLRRSKLCRRRAPGGHKGEAPGACAYGVARAPPTALRRRSLLARKRPRGKRKSGARGGALRDGGHPLAGAAAARRVVGGARAGSGAAAGAMDLAVAVGGAGAAQQHQQLRDEVAEKCQKLFQDFLEE